MVYVGPQKYLPWKLSISIFHGISIISTFLRIHHRHRTRKLWWDDHVTVIPALTQVVNIVLVWLRFRHTGPKGSQELKVLSSYLGAFCYVTIDWWSRISLAFAILRIVPAWSKARPFAVGIIISFVVLWGTFAFALVSACVSGDDWKYGTGDILTCHGQVYNVFLASTIVDVLADIVLITIPLHRLWHIHLPKNQCFLIRLVFSASVLTLVSVILLCVVLFGRIITGPGAPIIWLMSGHAACSVSIVTSNLLVLVAMYRHYFPPKDNDLGPIELGDVHITPHWSSPGPPHSHDTSHRDTELTIPDSVISFADRRSSSSVFTNLVSRTSLPVQYEADVQYTMQSVVS